MDPGLLATIFDTGGKLVTGILQTFTVRRKTPTPLTKETVQPVGISTEQTVNYQKRELVKELLLLEGHLEQGCKIEGKPCGCCEKHPIKIEGLALETISMTSDPLFRRIAEWASNINPITNEAASASGEYDSQYPKLAMEAREFRRAVMPEEVKSGKIHSAAENTPVSS